MKHLSRTDWDRVDALKDEEIDTSDIPPLDDAFFAETELRIPEAKPKVRGVAEEVGPQNTTCQK